MRSSAALIHPGSSSFGFGPSWFERASAMPRNPSPSPSSSSPDLPVAAPDDPANVDVTG